MAVQAKDYDIVGSYDNQRFPSINPERSINCFEYLDPRGKKPKALISTSGLINTNGNFATLGISGGFRAQFVFTPESSSQTIQGFTYSVVGNTFIKQNGIGIITILGTLVNTSSGYVGVDANTFQMLLVDGVNGYIYDAITGVFSMITDPAFPPNPVDCCFLDDFFIVAQGGSPNFQMSSFDQGLIWGPDNSGTASTFTMAAGSANIVITYAGGSIANYQIGTPIVFSGTQPPLPAEFKAGTTYYVSSIVSGTTITVSATDGGAAIISAAGGSGSLTNNGQLQQGSISSHPGNIVACRTLHRRLFLFSSYYTEVWENAGVGTNLPVRRNNSLLMEYGTPAVGSIAVSFDTMCFLSQTRDGLGPVVQVKGTSAIPISNQALDFQLAQYAAVTIPNTNPVQTQVSDCRAFLILENGLIFYRMNFTAANHTFVYNVSQSRPEGEIKLWHEEEVLNGDRHPAQTHAYFNGVNYVGNYAGPVLYQVDAGTVTNNGSPIRRARIPRPFVPEAYQRIRCDRFQIDMLQGQIPAPNLINNDLTLFTESGMEIDTESGQALLVTTQTAEYDLAQPPNMFLSLSRDGGQTYPFQTKAPMGRVGNRSARTVFRKLGTTPRGQAFQPYIEFYSEVPFIIMGASWVFEVMPE
jgi:hypothetical protein